MTWHGVRGTMANPVEDEYVLFGFLTIEPNDTVAPVHSSEQRATAEGAFIAENSVRKRNLSVHSCIRASHEEPGRIA